MNLKIERFRKYSKLVGLVIKAASILLWLSVLSGMIGLLYCAVSSEEDFGVFPAGEGTVFYVYKFPMPVITVCPRCLLFSAEQFQADSQAAQEDDS